jgi:hypothetical protein
MDTLAQLWKCLSICQPAEERFGANQEV